VIEGSNLTACGGVPTWTANDDQAPSLPSLPKVSGHEHSFHIESIPIVTGPKRYSTGRRSIRRSTATDRNELQKHNESSEANKGGTHSFAQAPAYSHGITGPRFRGSETVTKLGKTLGTWQSHASCPLNPDQLEKNHVRKFQSHSTQSFRFCIGLSVNKAERSGSRPQD
jgi:hypothetical protein